MDADPRPIVFLDWDGVLAIEAGYLARGVENRDPPFDPACLARFGELIRATGAGVVLSTSWRSLGSVRCGEYLRAAGLEVDLVGCTPWFKGAPRRYEIRSWLAGALAWRGREARHVVLDDDEEADPMDGSFVRTTMPTGLTGEHVELAVAWLMG